MYKGINLVPFMFGKYGTVEFRMHPQSFNKHKIAHWVTICTAIVTYAKKTPYKEIPGNLTLSDLLIDVFGEEITRNTVDYIAYRKEYCATTRADGAEDVHEDVCPERLHFYEE